MLYELQWGNSLQEPDDTDIKSDMSYYGFQPLEKPISHSLTLQAPK